MSKNNLYNNQNLIWIDLEMTGLDPETDYILEIATIVTDKDLNILAEGPVLAIYQSDDILANMNDWCKKTHAETGLIERVKHSVVSETMAEEATIKFLQQWVPSNSSPICGNSIAQDKRFLYKYMPKLADYFHYRHLDVSTLKELAIRWKPSILADYNKESEHIALDDIKDSINELAYYRQHFINLDD